MYTTFRLRPISLILALTAILMYLSPSVKAQVRDADGDDPDEAGTEEALNAQLWEYMKHTPYSAVKASLAAGGVARLQHPENELPTGWRLSPVGDQVEVGRFPGEAVMYGGKLVVLNTGYYVGKAELPEVSILDAASGKLERTINLPNLYPSAVASPDGDLYISGGISKQIYRLNGAFETVKSYIIEGYAGGLAVVDRHHIAIASLVTAATPADFAKGNYGTGRISILNTDSGVVEQSVDTGYFPYAIAVANGKIYASVLGEDRLAIYDAATLQPKKTLATGVKPQNMMVDALRLYVVNTGSDSISVFNTEKDELADTIKLHNTADEFGSAPISCAVDTVARRLYAALANANEVAVIDLDSGKRIGAIPTGWYPTKVLFAGDRLAILNGKGIKSRRPNVNGPQPAANRGGPDYVLTLLKGSVQLVQTSTIPQRLAEWTRTADAASPQSGLLKAAKQQIKHIFYIVRENRTYDQVMGDLPKANGDASLTLFGKDFTPNGHEIAGQFVTLDNFYADGEISVLGHSFTTSGYASPFLEWLGNANYSGKFGGYPFGMVPAATSPAYLWDALDKKGLDYRIYGENYFLYTRSYDILRQMLGQNSEAAKKFYAQMMRLSSTVDRGAAFYTLALPYYGKADTPEAALKLLNDQAFVTGLSHFLCGDDTLTPIILIRDDVRTAFAYLLARYPFNYRSWDLTVSDLDRVKVWKADFEKQVKAGKVASLHYIWLPNDHTGGTNKAYLPPDQLVGQNDAALGYIIETISHSPIWKQSLILVTEDDAQNGPDHVDATRTVALAAGPSVKRGAVVSDRYDQLSLLRTIESILGIGPLNQNDALAAPMLSIFANKENNKPYSATMPTHLSHADVERFKALEMKQ